MFVLIIRPKPGSDFQASVAKVFSSYEELVAYYLQLRDTANSFEVYPIVE